MGRNIKNIWISFLLVSFVFIITGCSSIARQPQQTPARPAPKLSWEERVAKLNRIQSWQLNGKIAVQSNRESGSASVDWTQNHGAYVVSLYGPMGANGIRLSGRPGQVTLVTADGKRFNAKSPEQLLAQKWGFHLPVTSLVYWVRGLPVPDVEYDSRFDARDRLSFLRQEGWTVQYQEYMNTRTIDLPSRISITSPSLKVRIIIYQWRV